MNKNWRIIIGIEHHWVTEEDKNFYLDVIKKGGDLVEFKSGLVLSKNFQSITSKDHMYETEMIEQDKWQCEAGTWHSKTANCYCSKTPVFGEGTTAWFEEKEETLQLKNENNSADKHI